MKLLKLALISSIILLFISCNQKPTTPTYTSNYSIKDVPLEFTYPEIDSAIYDMPTIGYDVRFIPLSKDTVAALLVTSPKDSSKHPIQLKVELYNSLTGKFSRTLFETEVYTAYYPLISPDKSMILTLHYLEQSDLGSFSHNTPTTLKLWNLNDGKLLHTIGLNDVSHIEPIAFTPDSSTLITKVGTDYRVFGVNDGLEISRLAEVNENETEDIQFSLDYQTYILIKRLDDTYKNFETQVRRTIDNSLILKFNRLPDIRRLSHNSQYFIDYDFDSDEGPVFDLWSLKDGSHINRIEGIYSDYTSPNEKYIVVEVGRERIGAVTDIIEIWEGATGKQVVLPNSIEKPERAYFSHDNSMVVLTKGIEVNNDDGSYQYYNSTELHVLRLSDNKIIHQHIVNDVENTGIGYSTFSRNNNYLVYEEYGRNIEPNYIVVNLSNSQTFKVAKIDSDSGACVIGDKLVVVRTLGRFSSGSTNKISVWDIQSKSLVWEENRLGHQDFQSICGQDSDENPNPSMLINYSENDNGEEKQYTFYALNILENNE